MWKEDFHLADEDLILAADGELSARRAARVRAHLAACWQCRTRMAEIETTIVEFVRADREATDAKLPPIDGSRSLLSAQLAELARDSHLSRWRRSRLAMTGRRLAYVFALVVLAVLGTRVLYQQKAGHVLTDPARTYLRIVPNPSLTPGSTRAVSVAQLCSTDHDEVVRSVPGRLRQEVFQEYGMAGARAADYEVDYLITPGLGGADDIRNLWPEPEHNAAWNSYVKDQLEDHLHRMVCGGQLGLSTAQQDIASDWISAYKKYFHTSEPLPDNSASVVSSITRFTAIGVPPANRPFGFHDAPAAAVPRRAIHWATS